MTVIACFGAAKLIKLLDAAIVTEYLHAEYEFNPGQRSEDSKHGQLMYVSKRRSVYTK